MRTDFEHGPVVSSLMLHYERPLRPGTDGFQVTALDMTSSRGATPLQGMGIVNTDMTDKEVVVDYGHRMGPRTMAGLSVLGGEQSNLTLTAPGVGLLAGLKANAGFGWRVGVAQEWGRRDYIGVVYSYSQNNVDTNGEGLGGVPGRVVYHGDQLNVGAAHHLTPQLVAAVEFERGTTSRGDFLSAEDLWHFGAEYAPSRQWAVRAGAAGGQPTAGVGYRDRRWHADYAYLRNINDSDFHALFGSSDTHAVHVTYCW
jgi:hypothetical protein